MTHPQDAVSAVERGSEGGSPLDELLPALLRLDARLRAALDAVRGAASAPDGPLRGLYVPLEVAEGSLDRAPGAPAWPGAVPGEPLVDAPLPGSRLGWLAGAFGLAPFDLDLLVVALAPEVDLRYERLFAYLQDDAARRRPTLDLALDLLCPTAGEKVLRRAHAAPDAPLLRQGILRLVPEPGAARPPLLAHALEVDEQVARLLLGPAGLDTRLAPFARLLDPVPGPLPVSGGGGDALVAMTADAWAARLPLRVVLHGPGAGRKRRAAEALAAAVGARLLQADLERLPEGREPAASLRTLFREAWFAGALLLLEGVDALRAAGGAGYDALLDALEADAGVTLLATEAPTLPPSARGRRVPAAVAVAFDLPSFDEARARWEAELAVRDAALPPAELDALAARFRLDADGIAAAADAAAGRARWRAAGEGMDAAPTADEVFGAARAEAAGELGGLARKLEARYGWEDIVLPADQLGQLREVCEQAQHRHRVLDDWGFDRKLSLGKGLNVLFSGPPGTGKTMAAEVVARELRLDLYRIDLSQIVSKYIGETEKNLSRIFDGARTSSAILFFDEADALFGKRSEVKDAHDRYANIETGYLLQKMEEYDGIVVLATNLRQNMDEAFVRRMHVIVEFPFPDADHRRRIWEVSFPAAAPLDGGVDFGLLGRELAVAGGNIRNIALAAAFRAAANGGVIAPPHIAHAARREFQKMGRTWTEPAWARVPAPKAGKG